MSMQTLLNQIRKRTNSTSLNQSKSAIIDHWLDTGFPALNRIASGSIYRGLPSGRVIVIGGESASGKSLVMTKVIADALKNKGYDRVFFLDSEMGTTPGMFEGMGVPTDKIEHIPVSTVEDWELFTVSIYEAIKDEQVNNPDFKALVCTDSIGALVTNKVAKDAAKGEIKLDQGLRAKVINSCMKGATVRAAQTNSAFICLNHIYQNPGEMHSSKVKQTSGGLGVMYMATLAIQCEKATGKDQKSDLEKQYFDSSELRFITVKNRIVQPFFQTEIPISFSKGTNYYAGLFEEALRLGFIDKTGPGRYAVEGYTGQLFEKDFKEDTPKQKEVWDLFMDKFDAASMAAMSYSSQEEADETDDKIKAEIKADTIAAIKADRAETAKADEKPDAKKRTPIK